MAFSGELKSKPQHVIVHKIGYFLLMMLRNKLLFEVTLALINGWILIQPKIVVVIEYGNKIAYEKNEAYNDVWTPISLNFIANVS